MGIKNFEDFMMHDLERLHAKQQSPKPPAPQPNAYFLSKALDKPLTWLWPGRIPNGHLTLLDAASGSGLSLMALTLAACISSGSPLPDGTPTQQGNVLLLAPYDFPTNILKPRLQAAGGDLDHVVLVHPLLEDVSLALARSPLFAFPQDLDHLASLIRSLNVRLVILDPASAIPGLARCLPALVELARQTNCAILLTRSLRQAPVDPFHAPAPTSPLLQAARSRLLLAPDPADHGQQLLLTTKQALGTQPPTLAYTIVASQAGIPTIHWQGERDHDQLSRLCTGPIRSPYRQAILRFLQHSDSPQRIPDILKATSYDREAGRKMLVRMQQAGELISPARGLYTTAHHPCLLLFPHQTSPLPAVPNVSDASSTLIAPNTSNAPSTQHPPSARSPQSEVPPAPAVPPTDSTASTLPSVPNVSTVPNASTAPSPQHSPPAHSPQSDVSSDPAVSLPDTPPGTPSSVLNTSNVSSDPGASSVSNIPTSQSSPPAHSSQSDVPSDPAVSLPDSLSVASIPNVSDVSNVSNSAHSTSEVAQQSAEIAPASLESSPKGNGTS